MFLKLCFTSVFRTQTNIYDESFCNTSHLKAAKLFKKNFIPEVQLGSVFASDCCVRSITQTFLITSPCSIALLCLLLILSYFVILKENTFIALIKKLAQKQALFKKIWYSPLIQ